MCVYICIGGKYQPKTLRSSSHIPTAVSCVLEALPFPTLHSLNVIRHCGMLIGVDDDFLIVISYREALY